MLFNSYAFILGFLPVVIVGYFLLARRSVETAALWMGFASLFFYGWWNPKYLPLLLGSVAINFILGRAITYKLEGGRSQGAKWLLVAGISFNLAVLAFYKYAAFIAVSLMGIDATNALPKIILPLGISFFTFTQIAFLVDVHRGMVKEYSPIHYLLFVTYFPHLIAGPVLHHREIMPQFANSLSYRWSWKNAAIGLTIFAIGLAKKVLIADEIAIYVGPVFDFGPVFDSSGGVGFFRAWGATLAYTLQLYFDFSGYSDMAIGLSRMFGVRLPLNFDSPYKARNIIDFWRRWHMTLSRFLRDYLYIPLGGNRLGVTRRHVNLMATMVLGGLWHGAGWTFVLWGALHGLYLVVNHAWREHVAKPLGLGQGGVYRFAAWLLTFLAVAVAWVLFRAKDMSTATQIMAAMAGANGIGIPTTWIDFVVMSVLYQYQINLTIGLLLLIWVAPNTQQLLRCFDPAIDFVAASCPQSRLAWRPSPGWFAFIAILLAWSLILIPKGQHVSEFLYFQF